MNDALSPTPGDLHQVLAVQPSDGVSGDRKIDEAFSQLDAAANALVTDASTSEVDELLSAGTKLHEVLQRRLDEASG